MNPDDLLDQIERYLIRTGMTAVSFGHHALDRMNFMSTLRRGSRPQPRTYQQCYAFMDKFPDGKFAKKALEKKSESERKREIRRKALEHRKSLNPNGHVSRSVLIGPVVVVDRTPCFMCGTRGDIGCEHYPPSEPVTIA